MATEEPSSSSPAVSTHSLTETFLNEEKHIGALIILNGPPLDPALLDLVWNAHAKTQYPTLCADGAGNLLFQLPCRKSHPPRIPTHIVGDLDSVHNHVATFYADKGTLIVKDKDQNRDDFNKSVSIALANKLSGPIVVVGGHGGRMDQSLGNLNTLYCLAENGENPIWLDLFNATIALSKGKHVIHIDRETQGPMCGLLPIGHRVERIITDGLKWNLNSALSFGESGLISTSNQVLHDSITLETSHPVLFTIELRLHSYN